MKHKLWHRILSATLAVMICTSILPTAAFADELQPATSTIIEETQQEPTPTPTPAPPESSAEPESSAPPETDEGSTPEPTLAPSASPEGEPDPTPTPPPAPEPTEQPAEENNPIDPFLALLYADLPDSPTGSYMGEMGLPIATGETKISIAGWSTNLTTESGSGHLVADPLNTDNITLTATKAAGKSYAIVPIAVQVQYPASGSKTVIALPQNATLLDYTATADNPTPMPESAAASVLNASYSDVSATASGFYVQASEDFTAALTYTDADGNTLTKTLHVVLAESAESETAAPAAKSALAIAPMAAANPEPPFTSGVITKVQQVNGTWLIWFNGVEAYCCNSGLSGKPDGCPTYGFAYVSRIGADQYVGTHYGNQVSIWGGLNQLSMGFATLDTSAAKSTLMARAITLDEATLAQFYNETQLAIIREYPDSYEAKSYVKSAQLALRTQSGIMPMAAATEYYTYIFTPPIDGWQTVALIGPPVEDAPEFYASWSVGAQSASGSFTSQYGVQADKIGLDTKEKVDDAVIEIEPLVKGGTIDGGSWSIVPAAKQAITTSGHTADDDYHNNGGTATASWTLSYSVSKTSNSGSSGTAGPCATQAEADAAAASAKASATSSLKAQAQAKVNAAIATAKSQLATLDFRYNETTVPYGFEEYTGENGSTQTIAVPANTSSGYTMHNDEWSLQVNITKTDSETGEQIAADTQFSVFEWDIVTQQYIPFGGYNQYSVDRQADGGYSVINHSGYATAETQNSLFYTQRNEGKFIIAETQAPQGYYGDWTDNETPSTAGDVLGKRAYYIEITADNDGAIIALSNLDYNADIALRYTGGTKLLTASGSTATVTIGDTKNAARTYKTGAPVNESRYTSTPKTGVFQNDRVLGEITLSKVDLDAARYLAGAAAHANATLDGAVYDLYAAADIHHPDGVTGIVDYSAILGADGKPVWHTIVRDNAGHWVADYLPILAKDHLVASAKIENGSLTFGNLYLGSYYVVERSTGVVLALDKSAFVVSGSYPAINAKTKQPTGALADLAETDGVYTDWVYKNQFSTISQSKALDGTKTYDGFYISYAEGYLADEQSHYIAPSYESESVYVNAETAQSQDQVMKGNVELSKIVSSSGVSDGVELEHAGFTFYLISDLSKAAAFETTAAGTYKLNSILQAYVNLQYDEGNAKYDFSGEGNAIAKSYFASETAVANYNETLTESGDFRNGVGEGWVPTSTEKQYQLAEIYSNDSGTIRVQGLRQYLVVETTTPQDVFQAQPFVVTVNAAESNNPQSNFCTPNAAVLAASGSYQKFTVLDEEIETYLRLTKLDEQTGKAVLQANTSFNIYWLNEDGSVATNADGTPKLVTMTNTQNGQLTKDIDTFSTDENGVLILPEKLPLGKYRIAEIMGPSGFYNEWIATGTTYHDFEVTTNRVYKATGDDNENAQDTLLIDEGYANQETLGKLTIRKMGEVLTGFDDKFAYSAAALAGAEFTITATEDIYTQDGQKNADGSRTLWYVKGDVVAVVTTGNGTIDTVQFAPSRTTATHDFLSVIHDETIGEVTVTLPLGSYHIEETKPPYGHVLSGESYDVTFAWSNQTQQVILDSETFSNERERAKVGVYKKDEKTGVYLAGAVFTLYADDDIFAADGTLLFVAGALVATSPETVANGYTYFDVDVPIRSEFYGEQPNQNSGNYTIVEVQAPLGYFLNAEPMQVTFTYDGQALQVLNSTCENDATSVYISKRELTGDDELKGATLTIKDKNGNTVRRWISGDEPMEIRGLHLGETYTLVESIPAAGYALASSIKFKLVQKTDSDGNPLAENEVYVLTGKDWLIFDHWTLITDGIVVMRDDITRVQISKQDIATFEELPGAHLTITDKNGNVVESWVSTDKPHYIEKLPAGIYTLTEVTAPDGYDIAESIEFGVKPTGEIQTITMYDRRTPVEPAPTPKPQAPQTGDGSNVRLYLALMAFSAVGLTVCIVLEVMSYRNSKKNKESTDKAERND